MRTLSKLITSPALASVAPVSRLPVGSLPAVASATPPASTALADWSAGTGDTAPSCTVTGEPPELRDPVTVRNGVSASST